MQHYVENSINTSEISKDMKPKVARKNSDILVIEDNLLVQFSLDYMVNRLGCTADFADSGKKALDLYHSNYQLILMDIDLPDVDGFEITKTIRSIEKENGFPNVPIVAMTSHYDEPEYQEKCLAVGMNGYSNKPTFAQLKTLLQQYLSVKNPH